MKRLRLFLGTELPVLCILIFGLGPWVWMMLTSLRPDLDLTHSPITLIPSAFTLVHYIELLGGPASSTICATAWWSPAAR